MVYGIPIALSEYETETRIPVDPGCSTRHEEPWWTRGAAKDGRKPPSFAEYTRVYLFDRTSLRRVCGGLTELSSVSNAHYLWCQVYAPRPYVEIWAHPSEIQSTCQLVSRFIIACSSERYPTLEQQKMAYDRAVPRYQSATMYAEYASRGWR